jgi:HEAT repeat protein
MSRVTNFGSWALAALLLAAPAQGQREPRPLQPLRPFAPDAALAAADAALAAMAPAAPMVAVAQAALAAQPVEPMLAAAQAALAAVPFGAGRPFVRETFRTSAPEPWLQVDPADSLYRAAREALNRREYERASDLFGSIRVRFPRSGYVPDSFYFQALALQRVGGRQPEQRALALLDEQREKHAQAGTRGDADQLRMRLQGSLAQAGNARAAAAVEDAARAGCDDPDQELRATALSALISMDSERAVPILREILQDRDECSVQLRRQAVFLIQRATGDQAVDILLDLAHRNPDPDPEVRQQAVFWLSRVRTPEAGAALEAILRDATDPQAQEQAVYALSQQRTPRAIEVLKEYAQRPGAPRNVRAQAVYWLGRDRDNGGPAYLRQVYASLGDSELKQQALHAVSQSGTAEDRAWLLERAKDPNEAADVRSTALYWASRAGMSAADLRSLYSELQGEEIRGQVIYALSRSDDAAAVEALIEIATNETDRGLRQNAVYWLGRSSDPRAAEFLLRLIRGR